jgi:hypothetical protein
MTEFFRFLLSGKVPSFPYSYFDFSCLRRQKIHKAGNNDLIRAFWLPIKERPHKKTKRKNPSLTIYFVKEGL